MRAVLDFLFPPRCRICDVSTAGERGPWVCQQCWLAVEYVRPPLCDQCGQPFAAPVEGIASAGHRCGACLLQPPWYNRARAVGLYQGVLRDILHAVKYQGVYGLIRPLGEIMQTHFACHWGQPRPDALVPVPLHRQRLWEREFDQALALAQHLSAGVGLPLWDGLSRHRPTTSQVGLNSTQRRRNVRGAFAVKNPASCADTALLLIDDVYTTGATVGECARLLRQAGAQWVGVYTLARVA